MKSRILLSIAAVLILLGCILFVHVMIDLEWDVNELSTQEYQTNTYGLSEPIHSICFNTKVADIVLAPSEDGRSRVVCYEDEKAKHSVAVEDGVLTVEATEGPMISHIGIHFETPRITVYLPGEEYDSLDILGTTGAIEIPGAFRFGNVSIALTTGDVAFSAAASEKVRIQATTGAILLAGMTAGELELSVSTGDITVTDTNCLGDIHVSVTTGDTLLTDVRCGNLFSTGNTGDLSLVRVMAEGNFTLRRTTGDIRFEGADAAGLEVQTDTGDVTGSLLTDKVFLTQADTGSVKVPQTTTGGTCRITTDTGDIHITLE